MKVSLKNIAEALNLSKATVSWILSGQGEAKGFSEATIKRVKDYAESVNYRPNLLARSLSLGTSNTIALIVCSSEGDGDKEFELIRTLKAKQVDGIIIAPTKVSKKGIDLLSEETFPYVLVDRYYPNLPSNYVIVNNTQSCYDVVHYLGKKGARKIALLTTDIHLYVMKQRVEGYRKALQDLGLDSDLSLELFIERQNYQTDIMDKLDCLFQEVPDVDGFFFSTHYLALEAIRYFINHQIDYQHRFHLGCFHETIALDVLAPEMCVSRMPIDKMGVEAVKILLGNIQQGGDFSFRNVVLENEFSPSFSLLGK